MLRSTTRLVFIQDNRLVCITAGPVQPHIAVRLRLLSRFVEHLQGGFIRMEHVSVKQFLVQLLIYRSQIILCCFQNPVRHGLTTQLNTFPVNLLLLPIQRRPHDKLLGHDMGNGLRRGKAAGDDVLLSGGLNNRSFAAFVGVFAAFLAGIGVVDVLMDNGLGRDDLQGANDFFTNLGHGIAALGAYQILTLKTMLHLLNRNTFRNIVQGILVLLVPLVGGYNGDVLILRLCFSKNLRLVEQKAQLLHEGIFRLLRGCAKLLMPGKTQSLHEQIYTAFKLRDFLSLSLKFLVFRAGNGDHFGVTCLVRFCLIHVNIIAYFC